MAKSIKQPVETPPYLKQVRIRDYAPLRDTKADFKPGLNIIIGKNGAGKTRFLSLTSSLIDLYNGYHLDGLGCEVIIAGPYEIKVGFTEETVAATEFDDSVMHATGVQAPLAVSATYGTQTINEPNLYAAIEYLTNDRLFGYSTVLIKHGIPSVRLPIVDESVELVFKIIRKKIAVIVSFDNAARSLDAVESRLVQALATGIRRAIWQEVRAQEDSASLTGAAAQVIVAQTVDTLLNQLNYYLALYSPIAAVRCYEPFQVYRNAPQDELIVKGLTIEYQIGDAWLPFSALSDGTKRLFYVITELLSPLEAAHVQPKIIFLEEPELGIHPKQLTKLLNLIREVSKENQVIMTTHSPQVLDMLTEKELDRITVCTLDPKKGTQFHKLSPAKQKDARGYLKTTGFLSDYWRYSYLEETEAE